MNILIYDNSLGYLAISRCLILYDASLNIVHHESGKHISKKTLETDFNLTFLFISSSDLYPIKLLESDMFQKNIIIVSDIPINIYYNQIKRDRVIGYIDRKEINYENIETLCNCFRNNDFYLSNKNKNILLSTNNKIIDEKQSLEEYLDKLSLQEYAILQQLNQGITSTEIAKNLNLHKSSVSTYKKRIFKKFSVKSHF